MGVDRRRKGVERREALARLFRLKPIRALSLLTSWLHCMQSDFSALQRAAEVPPRPLTRFFRFAVPIRELSGALT